MFHDFCLIDEEYETLVSEEDNAEHMIINGLDITAYRANLKEAYTGARNSVTPINQWEWEECSGESGQHYEGFDEKDAVIIYGGKKIAGLEKSLPDPEVEDVYLKLRTKLNDHFTPKKNKHPARLTAEADNKQTFHPVQLREFVEFASDDLTLKNVKIACAEHFGYPVSSCDVLVSNKGPSCTNIYQIPHCKDKVQALGLQTTYNTDQGTHDLISKMMALPFLPAKKIKWSFQKLHEMRLRSSPKTWRTPGSTAPPGHQTAEILKELKKLKQEGMKCWQCGRQGHIRKDCLNQTTGRNHG
ncbi:hypothetical protein ACROYT_G015299 [Oculina patagonica]